MLDDPETQKSLSSLSDYEKLAANQIKGVRTVLVVLSAAAMVYDVDALRQKILMAYPEATVFFRTTSGKPLGIGSFKSVDLLIDLTGPGQRQPWGYARKLRSMAKFAVGRNVWFYRKRKYDRVFDEKSKNVKLPHDPLDRERFVQRHVLALAGVPVVPTGEATQDRAKSIALDLPPLSHH